KRIGFAVKDSENALKLAQDIRHYTQKQGVELLFEESCASRLGVKGHRLQDLDVDVIVALGGDGTILRVLSAIKDTPILGINLGTAGYLTKIEPVDWKPAMEKLLKGEYTLDEKAMIDVKVSGNAVSQALNEAVVSPSEPVKMLNFEVLVDDCTYFSARADGIIIATPLGSTAYSLSAGGSILDVRVPAFVITPICPFNHGVHPVVVPQNSKITVRIIKTRRKAVVVVDGEYTMEIDPEREVTFELSDKKASFVSL
ncbi:MAG: NAD(+)/NADH kinase, partial [Candidatus Hydrothermarchaeales archaeon]